MNAPISELAFSVSQKQEKCPNVAFNTSSAIIDSGEWDGAVGSQDPFIVCPSVYSCYEGFRRDVF